jgi:hypothetical protein
MVDWGPLATRQGDQGEAGKKKGGKAENLALIRACAGHV